MSSAAWLCARADLRHRWRAVVGMIVLFGLSGGFAITALIGARRASTAWDRFRVETLAPDAYVVPPNDTLAADPEVADEQLRSLPGVVDAASFVFVPLATAAVPEGGAFANDERAGTTVLRPRITAGRRADPTRADEVTVNAAMAHAGDISPGDKITLRDPTGQLTLLATVVGIHMRTLDAGVQVTEPAVLLTPQFFSQYGTRVQTSSRSWFIRLRKGDAGFEAFELEFRKRFNPTSDLVIQQIADDTVTNALRLQ